MKSGKKRSCALLLFVASSVTFRTPASAFTTVAQSEKFLVDKKSPDNALPSGAIKLFKESIYEKSDSQRAICILDLSRSPIPNSRDLNEFIKRLNPQKTRTPLILEILDPNLVTQDINLNARIEKIKASPDFDIGIFVSSLPGLDMQTKSVTLQFKKTEALLEMLMQHESRTLQNKKIVLFLCFHGQQTESVATQSGFTPFERIRETRRNLSKLLKQIIRFNSNFRIDMYWILPLKEKVVQVKFENNPISKKDADHLSTLEQCPSNPSDCNALLATVLIELNQRTTPDHLLGIYYLIDITAIEPA
jgi:hypothetical protein